MGRVAGSYGVRGWVKVESAAGASAMCELDDRRQGISRRGSEGALGPAPGEAGRAGEPRSGTEAEGLDGSCEARADAGARGGHYYLADLVGLEVVNERGEALGVVKRWLFNGAQDVMEVEGEKARLIPWTRAVVHEVDLQRRQIHIEWGADW